MQQHFEVCEHILLYVYVYMFALYISEASIWRRIVSNLCHTAAFKCNTCLSLGQPKTFTSANACGFVSGWVCGNAYLYDYGHP